MVRRTHHTSGRRPKRRLFWVRNTGVNVIPAGSPAGTVSAVDLFDPLVLGVDPVNQRAEGFELTVHRIKFQVLSLTITPQDGVAGSALTAAIYLGIGRFDRGQALTVGSPAFSTAADAREDWMDVWGDACAYTTGGNQTRSFGTANSIWIHCRDVKAKRRLDAEGIIRFSMTCFPHSGTFDGNGTIVTAQWSSSILLSKLS